MNGTCRIADTVISSSVKCTDLPNGYDVNDVNVIMDELKYFGLDSSLITQNRFKVRLINEELKELERAIEYLR